MIQMTFLHCFVILLIHRKRNQLYFPVVVVVLNILEDWASEALDFRRVEVAVSEVVFSVNFEHRT